MKFIFGALLILSLYSCSDFIDVVPDNIAVIEDAFKTRDSAERVLASLYGWIPDFDAVHSNPALGAGDEIVVNDNLAYRWNSRILSRGGQNKAYPIFGYWGNSGVYNMFIPLRECNIFLENIDIPFDLKLTEKNRWIAETKVLKAFFHFYLMRMYGPIPIVRENIVVSETIEFVRVGRDTVDDVAGYIVELIDEAIPDLPSVITNTGKELGRITAPAAAALKARVLTTVASPLFNGNKDYEGFVNSEGRELISTTYDEEKWTLAAKACKEAIEIAEAANHSLYRFIPDSEVMSDSTIVKLSIRNSITERWNDEIIWGASGRAVGDLQNWSQARIAEGLIAEVRNSVRSIWAPTFRIAEMFYSENGVPIDEDKNYPYLDRYELVISNEMHKNYIRTGFETVKLHLNREPRFYASLGFDGGIWYGHGVTDESQALIVEGKAGEKSGLLDTTEWSATGYFAKKLVYYKNVQTESTWGYTSTSYPFPIIRLADLYLLYAETLNETGDLSGAQNWINLVRERAGLNDVVSSWTSHSVNHQKPNNKDGLREIIRQERLIELVFEGHRFWDLRRWKKAHELLNSKIRGWNVEGTSTSSYYNIKSIGTYKFLNRDYLWPISEFDIIRNPNLIQNPGW